MMRCLMFDSSAAASSAVAPTQCRAPTRSPYRPIFLAKDWQSTEFRPSCSNFRINGSSYRGEQVNNSRYIGEHVNTCSNLRSAYASCVGSPVTLKRQITYGIHCGDP